MHLLKPDRPLRTHFSVDKVKLYELVAARENPGHLRKRELEGPDLRTGLVLGDWGGRFRARICSASDAAREWGQYDEWVSFRFHPGDGRDEAGTEWALVSSSNLVICAGCQLDIEFCGHRASWPLCSHRITAGLVSVAFHQDHRVTLPGYH